MLDTTPAWLLVLLFAVGAGFSVLLAKAAKWLSELGWGGSAGAWAVYTATAANLFSDGLMTGASSAVSAELGLLLAFSQVARVPFRPPLIQGEPALAILRGNKSLPAADA